MEGGRSWPVLDSRAIHLRLANKHLAFHKSESLLIGYSDVPGRRELYYRNMSTPSRMLHVYTLFRTGSPLHNQFLFQMPTSTQAAPWFIQLPTAWSYFTVGSNFSSADSMCVEVALVLRTPSLVLEVSLVVFVRLACLLCSLTFSSGLLDIVTSTYTATRSL